MSTRKYVLDGHIPKRELDLMAWARWYETSDPERTVAYERMPNDVQVNTLFVSVEPVGTNPAEEPLLFQTVVYGGLWNFWGKNVATWEEAEQLHAAVVNAIDVGKPKGQFV
jgi:hypothetical protein